MDGKKICIKCGFELNANAQFCPRCGAQIALQYAPQGTLQEIPQSAPQGIPQSAPQGIPQGAPQGIPQGAPQGIPQGVPELTPIQQYNMKIKSSAGKIDVSKTILGNIVPLICMVLGIVLLIIGFSTDIPSSYISSYSLTEYVGGDAYNYIVEACIRGGRFAGAYVKQAVYISVGLLIACISALKIKIVKFDK